MTRAEIREAIQQLFAVFEKKKKIDAATRESDLRLVLDRLALASHFAHADPGPESTSPNDVPTTSRHELHKRLGKRFPELGDTLDDLVDIALDLEEVLRRWETDEEDAVWHFGFLFVAHWGQHLRALQLHLHERAFRGPKAETP
ncbi:DUF5063 domain-containing protein [Corallococcus sp. AB004]|nr:DUF5063 domain-containing protein [Corallococcus sp. AB004]